MKTNHSRPGGQGFRRFQCSGSKQFTDPHPYSSQAVLNDPALQEELSDLGFDLKTDKFFLSNVAGSLTVLILRHHLGKPGELVSLIEYRLVIAPSDRNGDIVRPDEQNRNPPRIIAIQVAGIHGIDPGQDSPRWVFEKTYSVGAKTMPSKGQMMADILQMEKLYHSQLQNIRHFFHATLVGK